MGLVNLTLIRKSILVYPKALIRSDPFISPPFSFQVSPRDF
ncbi:protein of unknown function [Shewanella benthica]|uniref:Uncharacterized protein n=1 Tax=Shewanella benthica TaxID=43661 RepID=A0A330MCY4_9GAMM|nr:protein of unknown function [Shewanella benthica]